MSLNNDLRGKHSILEFLSNISVKEKDNLIKIDECIKNIHCFLNQYYVWRIWELYSSKFMGELNLSL